MARRWVAAAGWATLAAWSLPGWAAGPAGGGDADVRRMIESLRPATAPTPAPAPAARSSAAGSTGAGSNAGRTRNLVIEPAAAPAAPVAAATPTAAAPAAPAPTNPAPSPSSPGPARPSAGLSLAIGFEPNSAQLRAESGATLGALVAAMLSSELRGQRFVIEGHTDAVGNPAQNLRLSRDRAEQVRLYLVTLGVDGDRLKAVGKGSSELANPRDPRSAENRRVRVLPMP